MMLKIAGLSNYRFFITLLAFIIFVLLINLSCGKRKPPQPPVEKVVQRVEITGIQRGNVVTLSWILPSQNASVQSVLNINRADIYRLAEPLNSPLSLSEEEFASRSTLIASLPVSREDFGRQFMTFTDYLEFGGQNLRLRYAMRFVNVSGQKASFSNFLLIEPTAKVAESPALLRAEISEEAILLSWKAPDENVDKSTPVNLLGYNIYRKTGADAADQVLNKTPVTDNKFSDPAFDFGTNYQYFVRAISLGSSGELIESLNSNLIEVKPMDVFPPSPPSAITIAAAVDNISIFFAVNTEKDLAGYRIYRSSDRSRPLSEWTLINKNLLTTNTFQDRNIEAEKTYFYFLTAVDKAGNVSRESEIISETAP